MKFVLFVEGPTDASVLSPFLRRWLDPRLPVPRRVSIRIVKFNGWPDYERGIAKKVALNLSGKTGEDVIAAIGLLDLYGPTFYPPSLTRAPERYNWGKKHLEELVNHQNFRQHFAVHELEAWLLSSREIFPVAVQTALPNRPPEEVNFDEHPARLLAKLYKQRVKSNYRAPLSVRPKSY